MCRAYESGGGELACSIRARMQPEEYPLPQMAAVVIQVYINSYFNFVMSTMTALLSLLQGNFMVSGEYIKIKNRLFREVERNHK